MRDRVFAFVELAGELNDAFRFGALCRVSSAAGFAVHRDSDLVIRQAISQGGVA